MGPVPGGVLSRSRGGAQRATGSVQETADRASAMQDCADFVGDRLGTL